MSGSIRWETPEEAGKPQHEPIRVESNGKVAMEVRDYNGPFNVARVAYATFINDMQGTVENTDDNAHTFSIGWMSAILMAGVVMHQNGAKVDNRALSVMKDLSAMGEALKDAVHPDMIEAMAKMGDGFRAYANRHDLTEITNPGIDTRPEEVREAHRIEETQKRGKTD